MARWLKQNMELPHEYDVDSTLQCAEMWKNMEIQHILVYRMITLDNTNLYTNILKMKF